MLVVLGPEQKRCMQLGNLMRCAASMNMFHGKYCQMCRNHEDGLHISLESHDRLSALGLAV
jgi:hypothetical protein